MTQGASYVQVPPQGTGKRVATVARTYLKYDNLTGSFENGDIVTGATSNAFGTISGVITEGFIATEGQLILSHASGTFLNNENLQVLSVTQAVAELADVNHPLVELDYQNMVISDPDNPTHQQKIDRFGATINTFTDGSPVFGSFGTMTVGEPQVIKDYRFAYDLQSDLFWDQAVGTGTVTYETTTGVALLTNGTANGDKGSRTTNFYHPYSPGVGHQVELTCRIGDNGKANVRRRWGYFDNDNGVFFEHDGTGLYIVLRSNTSGSPVDSRIAQSDWNIDKLDGTDNIGFTLDISNPNIYWIDLQWLGAGRVRFGIIESTGARIVAHVLEHANMPVGYPYMRTATLPIRMEQENTGVSAGTSEMRFACATVKHSSKSTITGAKMTANSTLKTVTQAGGEVPIFAYRPKTTFNSITNRAIIKGLSTSFANITKTGGSPVLFRVRAGTDASLTGEIFASHGTDSVTEVDTTATGVTPASTKELTSFIIAADETQFNQDIADKTLHTFELTLNGDATTQPVFIITAECLTGTDADVLAIVNWEEILR